jgi:hypothetical protein
MRWDGKASLREYRNSHALDTELLCSLVGLGHVPYTGIRNEALDKGPIRIGEIGA